MIGIAPAVAVSFLSRGWSGKLSDKEITSRSNFYDFLQNGDMVMADCGFTIDKEPAASGATLKIAPYCNICSGVRESDSKVSLTNVGNCLIVQLNRFFVSNGTVTKNSAPFFVSSPIEVVTEIEDEVFCTRKFNLAAVINHSRNLNSGHYTCLVKDGET